ncbi:Endonuclease V [Chthonomonas calidirosea]|uniref:deoxyribonuclease V n=1 Tax=Chthonomonas calidirosea TaxID=454171 RepID=UPI0006DD4136|nr:deoxyribonuclease V [Chthonomonas calidirosea]CEK20646.1 Endonuclease V [Chthonomonas calidirosea]CEK20662.1 Endonuclease V [Chthonomonas calidirosea]
MIQHAWNLTPQEAVQLQKKLAEKVRVEPLDVENVRLVAGCDISFSAHASAEAPVFAGIVVLERPQLTLKERVGVRTVASFPYIPGLLSFREAPPLLEAWARLSTHPDVLIADGQGLAHPRRFGIACHLGLLLNMPSIGVAKSLLVGHHEAVPNDVGAWQPVVDRGEVVGAALRLKQNVAPIYVSVGHRVDLMSAIRLVLQCRGLTRLPEPTRQAHLYVNALRRGEIPLD